jgi:hypothetical protein
MRMNDPRVLSATVLMVCASTGATVAHATELGVFAEAGTFGLGGGFAAQFNERFSGRIGYSRISGDLDDYETDDLEFDADVTIAAAKLLFDWYPTSSIFRVTAGAMLNDNKASAVADPTGGGYVINGTFYPAFALGSITGRADFDRFTPYLGVGWGRALDTVGRFNVSVDVGAAFLSNSNVTLVANCASAVPTAVCTRIQQDLSAEEAEIEDDADDLGIWPHASVQFSWRF